MAARFRPENAEGVLDVVEGYTLDEAGEHFLGRRSRLALAREEILMGGLSTRVHAHIA
jgi:hypothetical protein